MWIESSSDGQMGKGNGSDRGGRQILALPRFWSCRATGVVEAS